MLRPVTFALALVLAAGLSGAAAAQKIDAAGKCHDASGKFANMEVCKGAPSALGAATSASTAGKCRDKTTRKFAKCGAPNTEPVPAKAAAKKK
jgi:hypothetical protein